MPVLGVCKKFFILFLASAVFFLLVVKYVHDYQHLASDDNSFFLTPTATPTYVRNIFTIFRMVYIRTNQSVYQSARRAVSTPYRSASMSSTSQARYDTPTALASCPTIYVGVILQATYQW